MLDSIFSVHEIGGFWAQIASKTSGISVLSIPILLPSELRQNLPVLVAYFNPLEKVRSILKRLLQRHPAPPSPDRFMIAPCERLRNRHPHKLRRSRVMRIVQQPSS